MAMAIKTAAVLELPGKGNFAPNKFGSRYGAFIKTNIPGQKKAIWIFKSKLYDVTKQEDIDEFNEMCANVIPNCYKVIKLTPTPRLIVLPEEAKKPTNKKGDKPETNQTKEPKKKKGKASATPTPPALAIPPSGG